MTLTNREKSLMKMTRTEFDKELQRAKNKVYNPHRIPTRYIPSIANTNNEKLKDTLTHLEFMNHLRKGTNAELKNYAETFKILANTHPNIRNVVDKVRKKIESAITFRNAEKKAAAAAKKKKKRFPGFGSIGRWVPRVAPVNVRA